MIDRRDYEDYLVRLYFGKTTDFLECCISRAYRDFNRTLHGIAKTNEKDCLHMSASHFLKTAFFDLPQP